MTSYLLAFAAVYLWALLVIGEDRFSLRRAIFAPAAIALACLAMLIVWTANALIGDDAWEVL